MDYAQLPALLDTSMENHAFSGVVSVRRQGAVLYERAAGYADRSNRIANTCETRFGIASGTKFFTALAIGKLIEAQKLTFDTKLKDCVDVSFLKYAPEITIRHLLTHTSGIPDYLDEETIPDLENVRFHVPWYDLRSPRDYLAIFPDADMQFAPGERFSYSNGGYILLGVIIEEITGQPYQEFVEQTIFAPTGMHQSGYFAMNKLPEKTALGYIQEADGWRTNIYNLPVVGASDGGAFTTVQDIATLWNAFWNNEVLPQSLVEIYASPAITAGAEGLYYGHGLWIAEDTPGNRQTYIVGSDAGVSFKSSVYHREELYITVISNTSDGAWPVLRDIRRARTGEQVL